jgi:hypothetical protein
MTDTEISELCDELSEEGFDIEEVARDFDFRAALERAASRYPGLSLRRDTDPCQAECLTCCAIQRALVTHYLGSETPPAPGSSYSATRHWPEIDGELAQIFNPDAVPACECCQRLREASTCRKCGGGSCAVPAGASA